MGDCEVEGVQGPCNWCRLVVGIGGCGRGRVERAWEHSWCDELFLKHSIMWYFKVPYMFNLNRFSGKIVSRYFVGKWLVLVGDHNLWAYFLLFAIAKWGLKDNTIPYHPKQSCFDSTQSWCVYTLLKSVLLVWVMEVCCKKAMPLGIRGNGDHYK